VFCVTNASEPILLTWGSSDGRWLETVRIRPFEGGLRATGHIVRAGRYGASYSVIVGGDGVVRRASVETDAVNGERSLALTRNPTGNWLSESSTSSTPLRELAEAKDVYLRGSAFTASLPIRRLELHHNLGTVTGVAADVQLPALTVQASMHQGVTTRVDGDGATIEYSGAFPEQLITVDADGFVLTVGDSIKRLA